MPAVAAVEIEAIITGSGKQLGTFLQSGSLVIIEVGSKTIALADGAEPISKGKSISAAQSTCQTVLDGFIIHLSKMAVIAPASRSMIASNGAGGG